MNETREAAIASRQLTVDDLKQKALHIRDLAESETREMFQRDATKVLMIGAVAVVAALSIAYYLGTRHAWGTADDAM
ncbi:MAG: hypothetical protein JW733_00190 [Coriobacteriia bacterium]|nr:hypothetical protein [Coriobacteriia bacterium]MBN2839441.1 hypothetical protein [Coriobacteriia bacterium]